MPDSDLYCFISYSRRDADVARWLQQQLESYKYPAALVRPELRPLDRVYLRPIFLDTSDLPVSSGIFWDDIGTKIDLSRYLLVLCSRAAAASEYVDREIARFIGQNESRLENIVLAIIDPQINLSSPSAEDFPPQIFLRWNHFSSRNHALILPTEGESMRATRRRGLMQIISFMLRIEWTVLYNRHLIARRKALLRIATTGFVILGLLSVSLAWALWKQRELTKFETKVFPYSLVVGYTNNFLSPMITALEARSEKPLVIIVMPNSYAELDHNQRVENYRIWAEKAGYRVRKIELVTSLPRGAQTALIEPTPPYYKEKQMTVYVDFASTVAAFRSVIDYKKENPAYGQLSKDVMLRQYAAEFEESVTNELLKYHKGQEKKIAFVRSPVAALNLLEGRDR